MARRVYTDAQFMTGFAGVRRGLTIASAAAAADMPMSTLANLIGHAGGVGRIRAADHATLLDYATRRFRAPCARARRSPSTPGPKPGAKAARVRRLIAAKARPGGLRLAAARERPAPRAQVGAIESFDGRSRGGVASPAMLRGLDMIRRGATLAEAADATGCRVASLNTKASFWFGGVRGLQQVAGWREMLAQMGLVEMALRPCLCCGRTFRSAGPGNRLCGPCRHYASAGLADHPVSVAAP